MPQADVLFDKFPDDNTHRRGSLKLLKGKQFIQGDVEDMSMFYDNEFDFVNATHIIEHTNDPFKALSELMRIGKSGYIETPSFIAERLIFGSPNHKWVIVSLFDRIVFHRSRGRKKQNNTTKFKLARSVDFLFNTCHTKTFWGHGKAIKYRFRNENTTSLIRKAENFLSMTIGISTQYMINMLLFFLLKRTKP